jgi:hypothetical protein
MLVVPPTLMAKPVDSLPATVKVPVSVVMPVNSALAALLLMATFSKFDALICGELPVKVTVPEAV